MSLNPEDLHVVSFETEHELGTDTTRAPGTGIQCDSPWCAITIDRTCPHNGC